MLKNFTPKRKMTWFLIALIVYSITVYKNDKGNIIQQNMPSGDKLHLTAPENVSKFIEAPGQALVNKLRETPSGKAVVNALVASAIEEQYGTNDISTLAAKSVKKVLKFDYTKGTGETAYCGSKVSISSESFIENNIKFDASKPKFPTIFYIGGGKVIPGLEEGVLGMKVGGKRKLLIPAALAYDNANFINDFVPKNKPITMEVELLSVDNTVKGIDPTVQTTDVLKSDGKTAHCGDKVKISYKLGFKEKDNVMVTEPRIINFTIGKGEVPVGLENGMIGMNQGATIGMVLPPPAQITLNPNKTNPLVVETKTLPKLPFATFEVKLIATE